MLISLMISIVWLAGVLLSCNSIRLFWFSLCSKLNFREMILWRCFSQLSCWGWRGFFDKITIWGYLYFSSNSIIPSSPTKRIYFMLNQLEQKTKTTHKLQSISKIRGVAKTITFHLFFDQHRHRKESNGPPTQYRQGSWLNESLVIAFNSKLPAPNKASMISALLYNSWLKRIRTRDSFE